MANTICLSTDMQTLYLIPNPGTRSSLSLSGKGVEVSFSGGDVTAKRATKAPSGTEKTFSTANGQGTIYFDDTNTALEVIGIWDMEIQRVTFLLSGGSIVNVRIVGTNLIFTS